MEINERTEGSWRKVITVSVPAFEIQPQLEEKYKQYQKNVNIEGFRKGKVPRALVMKMFGPSIQQEVYQPYYDEAWEKVFSEKGYNVISRPEISSVKFSHTEGLSFNIVFDIRPEIESLRYDGMKVEKVIYEVTAKDVEDRLIALQEENAMIYSVEGAAEPGHILIADLQELDRSGVPMIGSKYENQQIWLSPDNQKLTAQLVGVEAGNQRQITLTMTGENDELETIEEQNFSVYVKEIKERKVPELDDEFAKDLGEFDTIKELREKIEKALKAQAATEGTIQYQNALTDEFIKVNDLEVPQSMLDTYISSMIKDYRKQQRNEKIDDEQLREIYKASAIRNVKWYLLREKLIETEGFEVTEAEIEAHLRSLEESGEGKAEAAPSEKRRDALKDRLLDDKIIDYLASKAEVNEVVKPWRGEEEETTEIEV